MEPITTPLETFAPSLLPPALGERCVACGSLLARDQRYCLECGERNGEPRLARMTGRPATPEAVVALPPRRRRPRASAGTTLVAGVGVLVLALGVGVEIGRSSGDNTKSANTAPVRLVVPTGAAATGAAAATATPTPGAASTTSTGSSAASGGKSGSGDKGGAKTKGTAKATPTPTPAASATPPPTVKLGQKGHGKGYKNGKFTGDFFGN